MVSSLLFGGQESWLVCEECRIKQGTVSIKVYVIYICLLLVEREKMRKLVHMISVDSENNNEFSRFIQAFVFGEIWHHNQYSSYSGFAAWHVAGIFFLLVPSLVIVITLFSNQYNSTVVYCFYCVAKNHLYRSALDFRDFFMELKISPQVAAIFTLYTYLELVLGS